MTATELVEKPKIGRPLLFETPEELKKKIGDFFVNCEVKGDVPTVLGLSIHLDCDRTSLMNYSKKTAFFPIVKKAIAICQHSVEQRAIKGKGVNAAFAMYWLDNNSDDWKNRKFEHRDVHHSGNITVLVDPTGGHSSPKQLKQANK